MKKAYTKIEKFSVVIAYFALQEWTFSDKNIQSLSKEMCEADQTIFDINIGGLDWGEYFYNYIRGVRVFLLKDPVETIPDARKKYYRLKCLHYFACFVLATVVLRLLWGFLSIILKF